MLTLKHNGHTINREQVVNVTEWGRTVKGYAGCVEYNANGKSYLPYITADELRAIKSWGFKASKIQAVKYGGTY